MHALSLTGTHLHTPQTHTLSVSLTYARATLISPCWFSLLPRGQVSNLDLDLTESILEGESGPLWSVREADF